MDVDGNGNAVFGGEGEVDVGGGKVVELVPRASTAQHVGYSFHGESLPIGNQNLRRRRRRCCGMGVGLAGHHFEEGWARTGLVGGKRRRRHWWV